jgi:hypothetical protein
MHVTAEMFYNYHRGERRQNLRLRNSSLFQPALYKHQNFRATSSFTDTDTASFLVPALITNTNEPARTRVSRLVGGSSIYSTTEAQYMG